MGCVSEGNWLVMEMIELVLLEWFDVSNSFGCRSGYVIL